MAQLPVSCPGQAVLSVHDTVAQKNFDPVLPPMPDDFEDELEEESVKIVRLVKNKEPLVRQEERSGGGGTGVRFGDRVPLPRLQGATIRRDDATGTVIVARIMRGGAADRSGKRGCLCLHLLRLPSNDIPDSVSQSVCRRLKKII